MKEIRVILQSDFHEFYDHWFDTASASSPGVEAENVFRRFSKGGLDKLRQFQELERQGLQVPLYAKPETFAMLYAGRAEETMLVVYLNPKAHRGEEKELASIEEALEKYPDKLCSVWLRPQGSVHPPMSLRYLRMGNTIEWMAYSSSDHWRSNCGTDVDIREIHAPASLKNFRDSLDIPLVAIDFVHTYYGLWAAVDLNEAPGIGGTPVEGRYGSQGVADAIKGWYRRKDMPVAGESLGDRVKQRREALKMTQQALAKKSSLSEAMVSRIESGNRTGTADVLKRLAAVLETTVSELLDG